MNERPRKPTISNLTSILILLLIIGNSFRAMSQEYFQQEVNYTIRVTLNDELHELKAFENIEYGILSNT